MSGSVHVPVVGSSFGGCHRKCSCRLCTDVFLTALQPWHNITVQLGSPRSTM